MTHRITLDSNTEALITEKARRTGLSLEDYLRRLAEADVSASHAQDISHSRPISVVMKELLEENLLTGYGDSTIDSPELARQLRERFERRGQ